MISFLVQKTRNVMWKSKQNFVKIREQFPEAIIEKVQINIKRLYYNVLVDYMKDLLKRLQEHYRLNQLII